MLTSSLDNPAELNLGKAIKNKNMHLKYENMTTKAKHWYKQTKRQCACISCTSVASSTALTAVSLTRALHLETDKAKYICLVTMEARYRGYEKNSLNERLTGDPRM